MTQYTIDQGEVKRIISREEAGDNDRFFVTSDEKLELSHSQTRVIGSSRVLPANYPSEVRPFGTAVYAHSPDAQASVNVDTQGFSLRLFGREIVGIDAGESIGDAPVDQQRRGALTRQEVNADQTSDLTDGQSETTTITADANELWELKKLFLEAPDDYTATTGDKTIEWEVRTEQQGVVVGQARVRATAGNQLRGLEYRAGTWRMVGTGSSANLELSLDNLDDIVIDDSNGLQFEFKNDSRETADSTRKIRAQFAVTSV